MRPRSMSKFDLLQELTLSEDDLMLSPTPEAPPLEAAPSCKPTSPSYPKGSVSLGSQQMDLMFGSFGRHALYGGIMVLTAYGVNAMVTCEMQKICRKNSRQNECVYRQYCPITLASSAIVGVNCLVFMGWQIPERSNFLKSYFLLSPNPGSLNPCNLVLCGFSHSSLSHLFTNMLALQGALEMWRMNDHRQCTIPNSCHGGEFAAFYLTSAVVTSLTSLLVKVLTDSTSPSLGASGAVCSLVAYQMSIKPNAPLPIILPTGHRLYTKDLFAAMVIFNFIGCIQMLMEKKDGLIVGVDHVMHLSGYAFGTWYANGGDRSLLKLGFKVTPLFKPFANLIKYLFI